MVLIEWHFLPLEPCRNLIPRNIGCRVVWGVSITWLSRKPKWDSCVVRVNVYMQVEITVVVK